MRRSILFMAVLGLSVACATAAALAAEPAFYVSGEGGASLLPELRLKGATAQNEAFYTGYVAGGALGYDAGTGWRLELNALYQRSELYRLDKTATRGHLASTGVMANIMYDLLPDEHFAPYLGVGFGFQDVGGEIGTLRGRAWKPAYQGEVGLRQDITRRVALFGEYRYSQSESVRMSDATATAHQHFEDHALLAGLRFKLY